MKFTIINKLLLVASLPIIALILFSTHHIHERFEIIQLQNQQLEYTQYIENSSLLIHELQLERGIASSYIQSITHSEYFKKSYFEQIKKSDLQLKNFNQKIDLNTITDFSIEQKNIIQTLKKSLSKLSKMREAVASKTNNSKSMFDSYTTIINILLKFSQEFKINSLNFQTDKHISILQQLLLLKEYSGQERALVTGYADLLYIPTKGILDFHTLISKQTEKIEYINFLTKYTQYKDSIQNIEKKYENSYFSQIRDRIYNHQEQKFLINQIFKIISYGGIVHNIISYQATNQNKKLSSALQQQATFNKLIGKYLNFCEPNSKEYEIALKLQKTITKILHHPKNKFNELAILSIYKNLEQSTLNLDSKKWFETSSDRINSFKNLESALYISIRNDILREQKEFKNDLLYQIFFTTSVIFLLLFGTIYTANKIKKSLNSLDRGLNEFFNFLNFKQERPPNIRIDSNDEIKIMADNINFEITKLQANLEEDKDFINEATQVVMLMKEGDFSERPYFDPHNPYLRELKDVLNELIELISEKIKEQTKSLERLNSSLEDKVFHQTNELYNQVQELTIARDKAIQAEIAKDEFLANMSHEIRTPLNAILGFVTILKKRIKEEKALNYLNIIDTSGKSLLTIINDILDFSKIQSGKFTISPKKIKTVEEFSNATLLFASKAYEKHIIYAVYIDPNLPQTISIDEVRVKQILSNLLSNAIKFTREDGEVNVHIGIEESRLIIKVQDSGIGISKENQSKVFTAFEQADGSTTRKYGGTGLGLSISSKLASLMNGSITLESEEKVGSTFTLNIPVEIIDPKSKVFIQKESIEKVTFAILNKYEFCFPQTYLIKKYLLDLGATNIIEINEYQENGYDVLFFIPDDDFNEDIVDSNKPAIAILRTTTIKLAALDHIQPLYAPFAPTSIVEALSEFKLEASKTVDENLPLEHINKEKKYHGKVLVVEDNKTNQMLISLILSDYGLKFKIANNGVEGVELFKKEKFDLVLMDENMPELNGVGAMKQIKEYEKSKSLIFTPIIALTASVLETDKEMFLNAGMDDFVGKPIDNKELEIVLDKYLHISNKVL